MVIANSVVALVYLARVTRVLAQTSIPDWALLVLIIGSICNVAFAVALFRWKKWGFWGFVITATVFFFVNLSIGIPLVLALFGFSGAAILYGVLRIGKGREAWSQLE